MISQCGVIYIIPMPPAPPMPPAAPMAPMAPAAPMPPAMPPMPATTPSIGEMLLKKEGWLRKEDASVVEVASSNRGGLGFQERTRH